MLSGACILGLPASQSAEKNKADFSHPLTALQKNHEESAVFEHDVDCPLLKTGIGKAHPAQKDSTPSVTREGLPTLRRLPPRAAKQPTKLNVCS